MYFESGAYLISDYITRNGERKAILIVKTSSGRIQSEMGNCVELEGSTTLYNQRR